MIKNSLFIYSIFSAIVFGGRSLPVVDDLILSTFLDSNELNVDGFDNIQLNLAEGNNPFHDDEMTLEIVKGINCEKTSVTVKRNKILVDKSTTVWYGENTYRGFGDISYEKSTIDQVPEGFPNFAMFQNYEEKVALVAFGNDTDWIWEGFIGDSVIQYVPGDSYVLLDVSFLSPEILSEKTKKNSSCIGNKPLINLNSKRSWIIPEILVALDWKSVENKTSIDVIKEVIVYYNAVDMLFSVFRSPAIQLNIAGIVIPKDSRSSPYFKQKSCQIEEEYYTNECISFSPVLDNLINHFRKYNEIFLTKDYDMIMGMTRLPFCDADNFCEYYGTSFESGNCENVDDDYYAPITGAVRHPHFRGNYFLAAREIGHMLGGQYIPKWAQAYYGGIMSEVDNHQDLYQSKLNWSARAAHKISSYVRKNENYMKCMLNVPEIFRVIKTPSTTETTIIPTTEVITTTEAVTTKKAETTTEAVTTIKADTTTEAITTVPDDDTTIISSTDISYATKCELNKCETPSSSTETTTTTATTLLETTTTDGTTIPFAFTDIINSTTTPDDFTITTTTTTSPTTSAATMTSTQAPCVTKNIPSTSKNIQSNNKINTNNPIAVIVVKGNSDEANNFLFKRPKTFKTIVGDVVDNIYYFVNRMIRKHD